MKKTEVASAVAMGIGVIIVIVGISAWFSSVETTTFEPAEIIETEQGDVQVTSIDKSKFKMAPELVGIADYINTSSEKLKEEINGKVVLYDIWTYSCINCVRTLPYITAWNDKYADEGLLIIGIHSPEFEFEKDVYNVQMAVEKHGITYPVVLDNDKETWKAFENRYWPRKYIADHEGFIRYDHIGEGKYDETERVIQKLLQERAASFGLNVAAAEPLVDLEEFQHTNFRTPELYFGYKFASGRNQLGNSEGFQPNQEVTYDIGEKELQLHYFYLDGTWKNFEDGMRLVSEQGSIVLPYHAKEVNIVASNPAKLSIYLDGEPIGIEYQGNDLDGDGSITINESGLYNIINSPEPNSHLLQIDVNDPGFEIYTFTFG